MTLAELIAELIDLEADSDSLVVVNDPGIVTNVLCGKLAGTGEPCVMLNYYPPRRETTGDSNA